MINKALLVGIGLMLVLSSLIASHTPINWIYFSTSVIVMALLIWLQKRELKKTLTESGNNELSLTKFEELLNRILKKLDSISKKKIDKNYSNELFSVIDEVMPNIDEYRISMINQYGVANYTQISIPFAKAERLINRGVSAAIDGYLVESQKSISNSIEFLKLAIDETEKIKVAKNG
jgi:hypothetical protein